MTSPSQPPSIAAKFWRWLYPGLYGLLIYLCVRLITDSASRYNVLFKRDWRINAIEIVAIFIVGYLAHFLLGWYENRHKQAAFKGWKTVFREFAGLALWNNLLMNTTIGVLVATTDDGMDLHDFVIVNTIPLLFVLVTYSIRRGNFFLKSYVDSKLRLERLEKDKVDTELSLLKSQYHPHFLFNALNTIYFQMDESTDDAKKTVEKLSELLRYQLYDEHEQQVPLSRELDYISSYIDLQKVRHGSAIELIWNADPAVSSEKIYPLLLMPLVENAFKYLGGPKRIAMEVEGRAGQWLGFKVTNTLEPMLEQGISVKGHRKGLGLANLRRRLELLYGDRFELKTEHRNDVYFASLKLRLNED